MYDSFCSVFYGAHYLVVALDCWSWLLQCACLLHFLIIDCCMCVYVCSAEDPDPVQSCWAASAEAAQSCRHLQLHDTALRQDQHLSRARFTAAIPEVTHMACRQRVKLALDAKQSETSSKTAALALLRPYGYQQPCRQLMSARQADKGGLCSTIFCVGPTCGASACRQL